MDKYTYVTRKVFDRHNDQATRRYVQLKEEVRDLQRTLKAILQWKADILLMGKAYPPPPPK